MALPIGMAALVEAAGFCKTGEGAGGCKALAQAKQCVACVGLDAPHSLQ